MDIIGADADAAGGARRVRNLSRKLVVDELGRGPAATAPDIVRRTGLARATVAGVLAELDSEGKILHEGRASTFRGRPAELLSLIQRPGHVGAVDLSHKHLSLAIATIDGQVIREQHVDLTSGTAGVASIDVAADELRQLMQRCDVTDLQAISLGIPGPLERGRDGTTRTGGVIAGWSTMQPTWLFQQRFGSKVPVMVDNDAHLGAIGEHAFGAARGYSTALYVKVGPGIGSGIIADNLLYRGGHGTAGEIGHIRVVEQGALCRCGGRGCLETLTSTTFLLRSLRALHGPQLTMGQVAELLADGDSSTVRLLEDIGETIGRVVAAAASVLDPDVIVIGSPFPGVTPMVSAAERAVTRHTQPFVANHTRVLPGTLGERASLLGAIARATRVARRLAAG